MRNNYSTKSGEKHCRGGECQLTATCAIWRRIRIDRHRSICGGERCWRRIQIDRHGSYLVLKSEFRFTCSVFIVLRAGFVVLHYSYICECFIENLTSCYIHLSLSNLLFVDQVSQMVKLSPMWLVVFCLVFWSGVFVWCSCLVFLSGVYV